MKHDNLPLSPAGVRRWLHRNWLRLLVHVGGVVPLLYLLWRLRAGQFLVDPVRETITLTGRWARVYLWLSLACTPLYILLGFRRALRARRPLGLYAFGYTALHLLIFAGWDYSFNLALLWVAIFQQSYVLIGVVAFVLLLILAITSLPRLRKRLGRNWGRVQQLVYLAAVLDVVHVIWLLKEPRAVWPYAGVLLLLLAVRLPGIREGIIRLRRERL